MELKGRQMKLDEAIRLVKEELERANKTFPLFNSKHEGYGILLEEVDELWDEIKSKNATDSDIQAECLQVAAMALKLLVSPVYTVNLAKPVFTAHDEPGVCGLCGSTSCRGACFK